MNFEKRDDDHVCLVLTDRELLAIKGALLEAGEAIRDDMAFAARIGVSREEAETLFEEVIAARHLLT